MTDAPPAAPSPGALPVAIVLPTFGRESVLLDTIRQSLEQTPAPGQVIVVDQSPAHDAATDRALGAWRDAGAIDWIRLEHPSQPAALNRGLLAARQPVVLFLDDDVRMGPGLAGAHAARYADGSVTAVAGRIIQPGNPPPPAPPGRASRWRFADLDFRFDGTERCDVRNGMSGNLSVRRAAALRIGGFDERFAPPVSYRFDLEFCTRLCRNGGRIVFEPAALIRHLRHPSGGTRTAGDHLTSASPVHGFGDYYFALRQGLCPASVGHVLRRPWREVRTRFHLRHPWWIPVKLLGEARAFAAACCAARRGPRLLAPEASGGERGSR